MPGKMKNNFLFLTAKKKNLNISGVLEKNAVFFCCSFKQSQFYIDIARYLLLGYHRENVFVV